jgi:1-acyl-sn-glycerol-3-phosphate acyltransferase
VLGGYAQLRRWLLEEATSRPPAREASLALLQGLCRWWWRVDAIGLERIPTHGPVLLMSNRAGSLLPYESLVVATALRQARPHGRTARPLVDEWVLDLPVLGPLLIAAGARTATPASARAVVDAGEVAAMLPEAPVAGPKPPERRYRISRFARGGFFRLAVKTGTPIVPVAVIGAEEAQPVLYRLDVGGPLGLPALAITPTFPLLGIAGLVPLPVKWTLHVGEPVDVAARYRPEASDDPMLVRGLRDHVRERLQGLVSEGVRRRRGVFVG